MIAVDTNILIVNACELLKAAEREQQRAEEDVVSHLICSSARQSLANYLTAFLLQQDIALDHPSTLDNLLQRCKSLDARFDALSLDNVHCRCETEDEFYCLDQEQVDHCLEVAQMARSIVMHKTPGY